MGRNVGGIVMKPGGQPAGVVVGGVGGSVGMIGSGSKVVNGMQGVVVVVVWVLVKVKVVDVTVHVIVMGKMNCGVPVVVIVNVVDVLVHVVVVLV